MRMKRTSNICTEAQAAPRTARHLRNLERRATHNAVEKMRREDLHTRFVTLASLLPPLRRRSKAAIVNSTIATLNAERRHRVLAVENLYAVATEAEQLRMEVNEWRARALLPQLGTPVRSVAHLAALCTDVEDCERILKEEAGVKLEGPEEGEDLSDTENDEVEADVVSLQAVSQRHWHVAGTHTSPVYPTSASTMSSGVWWADTARPPTTPIPAHHQILVPPVETGIADVLPGLYDGVGSNLTGGESGNTVYTPGQIRGPCVGSEPSRGVQQLMAAQLRDVYEQQRQILEASAAMAMALPMAMSTRVRVKQNSYERRCAGHALYMRPNLCGARERR
ncbi:hypothetical protein B0H12DRAFT_1236328 [Mycena haematopus]|nr:hypothetical protein B0H12DRAFT_1236328 [Mycena haematopus]